MEQTIDLETRIRLELDQAQRLTDNQVDKIREAVSKAIEDAIGQFSGKPIDVMDVSTTAIIF